jgi:lauroyl/myristoyl acyltransferase
VRQFIRHVRQNTADAARALVMLLVLRPAADWFPRKVATGMAQFVGLVIALSPTRGRTAYNTMRSAFGYSRSKAFWAAQQWLARPFLDFVVLRRVLRGREKCTQWKHTEIGSEAARDIKESGQSFIVACAHFSQQSRLALLLPDVLNNPYVVMNPYPPRSLKPLAYRLRLQFGQLFEATQCVRGGAVDLLIAGAGARWFPRIVECLRQPGNTVLIHSDAYRTVGHRVLTRDFAGLRSFRFAVGTAVIARLAQCPIVPCTTLVRDDETIVIEWGTPIQPPAVDDKAADVRITGQLVDHIERAIGSKPEQYVLAIGASRRWNAAKDRWEEYA